MKKLSLRSGLLATTTICGAALSVIAGSALMLTPTQALAQSAVGNATGKTDPGATVTMLDTETGVSRSITASASGEYSFSAVPPGLYTLTSSNGVSKDVEVKAGLGVSADLTNDTVTVVVRGSRTVNPIDVKSVESTSIFTASQMASLPINREISSVALLAPGTVKNGSPADFGNTVSIGGSSVAENGYYINGFDVTNLRTLLTYADIPFDAIGQEQIKTGGYGAEYGRSLGGVISLVTKRGTNKWKFGGSMVYAPAELKTRGRDVLSKDPDEAYTPGFIDGNGDYNPASDNHLFGYRSANTSSSFTYTEYASGPIIKDKLFMFAAIQGQNNESDVYRQIDSYHTADNSPQALLKLDWYITPNHHLEYTGIRNKDTVKYTNYTNSTAEGAESFYSGKHENFDSQYNLTNGGDIDILKYTGHLTENFTVSVQGGHLKSAYDNKDPRVTDPEAAKCVRAFDSRASASTTTYIGCYSLSQVFIPDLTASPESDERTSIRIDADWQLGNHEIRFGYDGEKFTSSKVGEVYTGGEYWRHYLVTEAAGRTVNGELLPVGTNYARRWVYTTGSSSYDVENSAWYVEDSWQINPNLLLYAGLRSESFTNKNGDGEAFVHADNSIAPRLGFSWDVNGDGDFKVFGNAGRFYIPVASNTNIRASGIEATVEDFYVTTGVDTATGLPIGQGRQIGGTNVNGSLTAPAADSVADNNLSPMYQDEFILGSQKRFSDDLTLGVRGIYRQVKSGMDDHCSYQPYISWAADQGYDMSTEDAQDALASTVAPCQIINPGEDVTLSFDANGDGTSEINTVDASYFKLPKFKRSYMAVELFGEWRGSNWNVNGSYTLSASRGNVEGYVNTSLGQVDAGATQDFDNFKFEEGSSGFLPNDRRHSIKLFGNYKLNDEVSFSGNFIATSGRPLNCFGFVDTSDPSIGYDSGQLALYSASSFYCMSSDGTVALKERGTSGRTDWTFTFDAGASYTPNWAQGRVTFRADIFNLFNAQTPTALNEVSEKGSASNFQYSPNYLLPSQYQTPRSARVAIYYNF